MKEDNNKINTFLNEYIIEVKNRNGKEILKFFQSLKVNTSNYNGDASDNSFYGIKNGVLECSNRRSIFGKKIPVTLEEALVIYGTYEMMENQDSFPEELINHLFEQQQLQFNRKNIQVFCKHIRASKILGGFDWEKTELGYDFYHRVLIQKDYDYFFEKFPKKTEKELIKEEPSHEEALNNLSKTYSFRVGESMIEFPVEIVEKMVENQINQGNSPNISVFTERATSDVINKGFTWSRTTEGFDFWRKVIQYGNYEVFYSRYPKKESTKTIKNDVYHFSHIEVPSKCLGIHPYSVTQAIIYNIQKQMSISIDADKINRFSSFFSYAKSTEGADVWLDIKNRNYSSFYELYPLVEKTDFEKTIESLN